MSPGLREAKLGQIDEDAAHERAGVEYIVNLIEDNEIPLRAAFAPEDTPEEQVPELLYSAVTKALNGLAHHHTRPFGVMLAYMTPGKTGGTNTVVKLGWARYSPALPDIEKCPPDQKFPHILSLTEAGLEIINGWRAARGQTTLEEQARLNRERWNQTVGRHRRRQAQKHRPA